MRITKVCHITSVHPRNDSRIFYKECRSLADGGFDVSLVVADGLEDETVDGIKIYNVRKGNSGRLIRMTLIVSKVFKKSLELDADIYHFHDPELLIAAYFLKRKGKVVIYDVHEDVPQDILIKTWLPFVMKKLISSLYTSIEKFVGKRLDYLITTTDFINNRVVKYQSNTICIKNYSLPDDILENVVWNQKSIDLCYIGGINEVRGIYEMINLIQGTDLKMSLSGLFENDALFTRIQSLDGWKNVTYNGYVFRNEAKQILRDSKIGLLILHPTQTHLYSLPIKLFEYMAAGLPIIASDFQNWKEIIEGNNCGYCIDPFDKKMQLEKIEFLINNPFIAQQMGRNGTIAVKEKFNWNVEAKKLVDLYLNLSK